MNRLSNRKKQRRAYLRGKLFRNAILGLFGILGLVALHSFWTIIHAAMTYPGNLWKSPVVLIFLSAMTAFIGSVCWYVGRLCKQVAREIPPLVYVPPVTPDTLLAEEVLVRGAGEPLAASGTLLRAVSASEEAQADELLRGVQR